MVLQVGQRFSFCTSTLQSSADGGTDICKFIDGQQGSKGKKLLEDFLEDSTSAAKDVQVCQDIFLKT